MKTFFDGMQIGFHIVHIHQIPETEQSKHEDWNRKPLEKGVILTIRHYKL